MRSTAIVLRNADNTPDGVSLSVACVECGVLFEFSGVETTSTVLVSEDRTEVRMLIREGKPDEVHHV